jgi:hypothetical protein
MLVLYLYGTLCVYALTVAKSLNQMATFTHAYYIYLTAFGAMVVPLSFGSFENTKPLQVVIAYVRFAVFLCMLALPIQYILNYEDHGTGFDDGGKSPPVKFSDLKLFNIGGTVDKFVCVWGGIDTCVCVCVCVWGGGGGLQRYPQRSPLQVAARTLS